MPKDKLSIIIPIYNPHKDWEIPFADSLAGLSDELADTDYSVALVNDGSNRKIEKLDEVQSRFTFLKYYSYEKNMGKGYAVRYGMANSEADYYFYTDMDFPFGYRKIRQAYQMMKESGTNVIIGTRDCTYFNSLPPGRKIISLALKEMNYFVTGFHIKDTQAGFKGIDNKAKDILVNTKINGFIFDLEFLKRCLKKGLSYSLINVTPRKGIIFTDFRLKTIGNEIINFFKVIF